MALTPRSVLGQAPQRGCPGLLPDSGRRLPRRGVKGGDARTGRSPVDRGRMGSKHHLISDSTGVPRAALTGGNRNDVTQLISLLQAVPPVRANAAGLGAAPDVVLGDRGYDHASTMWKE